jgi:uncharacterized protein (DUF4415 family)
MSEKIIRRSLEDKRKGKTDWARVDALTEKDLKQSIAADADTNIAVDWTKARLVMPRRKESVHLRIDPDVLAWFRQQGQGYLTRMNAVLRAYMDAQRPR